MNKKNALLTAILIITPLIILSVAKVSVGKNNINETQIVESEKANFEKIISDLLSKLDNKSSTVGKWHIDALRKFYKQNGFQSVWFDSEGEFKRNIREFNNAIYAADLEGLNPADYEFAKIANAVRDKNSLQGIARSDIELTNSILHYIKDLTTGRSNPSEQFPLLFLLPQKKNYAQMLSEIVILDNDEDIAKAFADLSPNHEDYKKLRIALAKYKILKSRVDSWNDIKLEGFIKPGESNEALPEIRKRMQLLGRLDGQNDIFDNLIAKANNEIKSDINSKLKEAKQDDDSLKIEIIKEDLAQNPSHIYDEITEKAIRRFQDLSGAKVDGVIGAETIKELNTPLNKRIRQIELSMERWRWLPESLGDKYVLTNIAGFYTEAVENNRVVVRSPVIVGKVAHQTPAFSSYITNVKFYPDWTVPKSIAKRYLIDKIRRNPGVIDKLGYEIYQNNNKVSWNNINVSSLSNADASNYTFRQKPGPQNALGLVRFSIDNDYSIYMHDTPNHNLFESENRAFSSGCIRVQKREDLAAFLLDGNSDLTASEAREKFNVSANTNLSSEYYKLNKKIPVHIVYMTAWVDNQDNVRFGNDIYNRDDKLTRSLIRQEGEF